MDSTGSDVSFAGRPSVKLMATAPSQMMESPVNAAGLPTDYISALARYGSLNVGSDSRISDSHVRRLFSVEPIYGKSGTLTTYGNRMCQSFDSSAWEINSQVIEHGKSVYDPVVIPEDRRCDACLGILDAEELVCKTCRVRLHRSCYRSDPQAVCSKGASEKFKCDVCSNSDLTEPPRCHLCKLPGGAMRFSRSDDVWVHSSCVFFAPGDSGIAFGDPLRMSDPTGILAAKPSVPDKRRCDACESFEGLLTACSYPKCFRYLHHRCALFYKGYEGAAFSDMVYYWIDERRQYFTLTGTFCNEHATHEYVLLSTQMHLRRRNVIRDVRSSSYRRYQREVLDMVRLTTTVTASVINEDEEEKKTIETTAEPSMRVETCIKKGSSRKSTESDTKPKRKTLGHWVDFFRLGSGPNTGPSSYTPTKLILDPNDDEIVLDRVDDKPASNDELPVLEVQTSGGDGSLDTSNSQYRSQRMMWQKFDIFRPIPYGPYADDVLANLDINLRRKSLSEYASLESTVLTSSDFLEPRELGEIYMQQIMLGCKGVMSLMESLKADIDKEIEAMPKNGAVPTLTEKKHIRYHVLVDTGRTAGIVVFKVEKGFLETLNGEATFIERGTPISASEANFVLDEEIRNFISNVHTDLVKNTYNSSMFMSSTTGGAKEIDVVSGVAEFSLKEDLRLLHSALNAAANDSDVIKMRRKKLKNHKSEITLKKMEMERFIELTPLECEILRRCTLEMSHTADSNIKLAVMKHTMDVSPSVSCLQVLDWDGIVRHIQNTSRSAGASSSSKGSNSRTSKATQAAGRAFSTAVHDMHSNSELDAKMPPVPMIYLGKETWPVVDDLNFLRSQKELTESELTTVLSQLRKIRQNIREKVLEMNSRRPKINDKVNVTNGILEQYEAMDRWSALVVNFCRGLNDSLVPASQSKTIQIPVAPNLPAVETPKSSDIRNAAKKAEGIIEGAYCSVCFINVGNNLNPVYTCSRCFMSCHRNCYGVGRVGKETEHNDYICRRCEYERRSMGSQWQTAFRSCSILCSICGRGGGALKRCDADEWSHVFCLLALMPETVCTNYTTLEPWTLAGVARWRRENACAVCGIQWGFVIQCEECDTTAHPLCAWLHGYKFSASGASVNMTSVSHTAFTLREELRVTVVCNDHDESRQWEQYVTMRNKRFLNRDTAFTLFEGKDKKRKLRSLLPECLASTESMDMASIMADINEMQKTSEEKRCGVCFGTGDLVDFKNCPGSVHYWCYVERDKNVDGSNTGKKAEKDEIPDTIVCDVCRNNDEGAVCGICKVPSGVLKEVPGTGARSGVERSYFHVICAICFPEALVQLYRGMEIESEAEEDEPIECFICNSTEGLMVTCANEECDIRFHATCGRLNGFTVEAHCLDFNFGMQYVAYCQQHSLVCANVGPNIKLLLRFRIYLKLLLELVTDLAAHDTVMRAWYRKRQELMNAELPLNSLIQKHTGKP